MLRSSGQAGFTLIEMIVVLIIAGLVAGLVMVKQPWHSAGLEADVTLRAVTNGLLLARSRAIAQDRTVAVVTGPAGLSIDGGPVRRLPSGQMLSPSRIVFLPDGGSTGGAIFLAAGGRRIRTDINWLTGRVRSREAF
jgi:general secretion pathway protein H